MSAEYNITFDWNRISTLGKVKVLVEQVISSGGGGGGGGADERVDLINGSSTYPLISVTKTTVSGVSGVVWRYQDGSVDGYDVFVADGTGLNTVKTAIEAELSDVVSAAVTGETGSNIEDYNRLTITNRDGTTSVLNVAPVNTSTGKLSAANLPMKSTIMAGNTDPVNSVAVIAYAGKKVSKTTVSGTSVTQELTENTFYVFGEVTSLTVTLATPSDANIVNEYHFRFTSGSTATVLSLPASVVMNETLTVEANKTYELSIIDNYGVWCAW